VSVLTVAAVVAMPGSGPASALDGCGRGTAATRPAAAGDSTDLARTGSTAVALSSTTEATIGDADPTDARTDDPSPEDRPTGDDATADPGGADPTDPSATTESPGETESPGPSGGPAEPVSLSVAAEASPAVVEQGDTVVLTIAVSNDGPGDDPGVVVDTQLPDGVAIDDVDEPGFDDTTGLWDVGELVAGETRYLTVSMTVTSEPDLVSAGPTVTGEAADSVPMDDQDCATVEVQTSSPGSPASGPAGGGPRGEDNGPATSAGSGSTPPGDGGASSTDPSTDPSTEPSTDPSPTPGAGGGDTTAPSGTPGGSGGDAAAGAAPSAAAGAAGEAEAQGTSDVSSDRTSSEAALMMLAWMLVVAGIVLLVLGRLRRKKLPAWYV
jgi:uncharacterized repeat protein (TIGR01451 family)